MHIPEGTDLSAFISLCKNGRISYKTVVGAEEHDIVNELPTACYRVIVENHRAGYRGHKAVWFFDVDGKIVGTGAVG